MINGLVGVATYKYRHHDVLCKGGSGFDIVTDWNALLFLQAAGLLQG